VEFSGQLFNVIAIALQGCCLIIKTGNILMFDSHLEAYWLLIGSVTTQMNKLF